MKTIYKITAILLIYLSLIAFKPASLYAQNHEKFIIGNWLGSIEFQGKKLPLVFRVIFMEKDSIIAFMDSPDQGAKDIKVTKLLIRNDSVIIKVKSLSASVSGLLNTNDSTISGVFRQSIFNCPITLKKTNELPKINRPQEPKPPFKYNITEVDFENYKENVSLSGTLTIPEGEGKFPAVVLVSGSGPQNRDEEILGHKSFWVIADYLTRNRIAVLRYDDRGVGKSKGNFNEATSFNFANDAEAAVIYLKSLANIDTNRIGIIGHSEGGMIAPLVASKNKNVGFIVLLAGPGITGEQILIKQGYLIARSEGEKPEDIEKTMKLNKKIYRIVINEPDNTKAGSKIRKVYEKFIENAETKEEKAVLKGQKDVIINQVTSPWFRSFLSFDPAIYLSKTHCPVLALNGGNDLQVPADDNLIAIEKHLTKAGNKNFSIKKMPELNHLFQHSKTGALNEYVKTEETFSPEVLEIMAKWINEIK